METIYLRGAEDVERAGRNVQSAADQMQRAAATIQETLTNFQYQVEQWFDRLEALLAKRETNP